MSVAINYIIKQYRAKKHNYHVLLSEQHLCFIQFIVKSFPWHQVRMSARLDGLTILDHNDQISIVDGG